jgi:integral membrane protein
MIEGLSFLVLLFVAMPAKHIYGHPEAVSVAGLAHGLLFLLFFFMATLLGQRQGWSDRYQLLVILTGVMPFGCLFLEKSLRCKTVTGV